VVAKYDGGSLLVGVFIEKQKGIILSASKRLMNLLHLANFGSTNVGNGALIDGTERVIREDFPEPVEFVHEPWDDYFIEGVAGPRKFDQTFVDKVNACDALIVGGAVMFREDHIRFKMPRGINKPIVFYGVSYRVWGDSAYYLGNSFGYDMRQIFNEPWLAYFGVRNDGTERWLWSKVAHHSDRVEIIPDPALYIETVEQKPHEIEDGRVNIVVALNNEDAHQRFGYARSRVMLNIADGLKMFWEQDRKVNFIFSPHASEDYRFLGDLMTLLPTEMLHQNVISTGIHYAYQAPLFYDLYRHVDLVLAMRIHAMSPAIGLGTPMIALSSQKRMTEFMKDAGLEYYCLDIFDQHLPGLLYGRMEAAIKYPDDVKEQFRRSYNLMRHRTWRFNQRIYNFIKEAI